MQRKSALWLVLGLFVALALPVGASAQEDEEPDPMVLRLSFFKCDLGGDRGDRLDAEYEEKDIPIYRELVSEGMIMDHGYFYHWWADEWNVGVYTIAPTIQAILDATAAAAERFEERFGDGPTVVEEACPEHKDGFYTLGPSAGMPPGGGN